MEAIPAYTVAIVFGVGIGWGTRKGLSRFPFGEEIVVALIWALFIFYLAREPYLIFYVAETDIGQWLLAAGVPWTICALGAPIVLPHLMAYLRAGLRDSDVQWLLTVVAAVLSYGVLTFAQLYADALIQKILQTRPDQLPAAQRALTAIVAIYSWIGVFYLLSMLALLLTPVLQIRASGRPILNMTTAFPVFSALLLIPLSAEAAFRSVTPADEHGRRAKPGSFEENLILWTSFMPNRLAEGVLRNDAGEYVEQARLVCFNLPPGVYVAFAHPDEVVPDKVIVAEPRSGRVPERGPAFSYRLSECQNSNNPDGVR